MARAIRERLIDELGAPLAFGTSACWPLRWDADASLFDLAAAFGLAQNHPLLDGNRRISLVCAPAFLERKGFTVTAPEDEAAMVVERPAAGTLREADIASWPTQFAAPA